jgi:hypothetical protein
MAEKTGTRFVMTLSHKDQELLAPDHIRLNEPDISESEEEHTHFLSSTIN